jgi:hypothetical protein
MNSTYDSELNETLGGIKYFVANLPVLLPSTVLNMIEILLGIIGKESGLYSKFI